MAKDPAKVAQHWKEGMQNSVGKIEDGVRNTDVDPIANAIAKKDNWLAGVQAAAQKDRYAKGLRRTNKADWQAKTIAKLDRIHSGAEAAEGKVADFMEDFLPYVERGAAEVRKMPNVTLQHAIARSTAMITHNFNYERP